MSIVEPTAKPELAAKLTPLASLAEADVRSLKPTEIAEEDPLMNSAEFIALKHSVKESGIREPITLFRRDNGALKILDGRNRYNAATQVGHRWRAEDFRVFNGTVDEARKFAGELNDIRRHLDTDGRRKKAQRLIEANPGLSSRAIAAMCGVSHTLIAVMRREIADNRSKEEKLYDKFTDGWIHLPLTMQEKFVREFRTDLNELLRSAA